MHKLYQRKDNRKWTWEAQEWEVQKYDRSHLINNRWKSSITVCRPFTGPDTAPDHKLVMAGVRMKLRGMNKEKRTKRFNDEKLREEATRRQNYNLLQDKWKQVTKNDKNTVEEVWKEIK